MLVILSEQMLTSWVVLKLTCSVAKLQSVGIFCLDYCEQGLCGSNMKSVDLLWNVYVTC